MDRRLGHDFGAVRVHADAAAARAAATLGAKAYTRGDDVVFGAGHYAPHTARGRWLVAHELAHVAQRRAGTPASDAAVEPDASRAAADAVAARPVRLAAHHDGSRAHCFGEPRTCPTSPTSPRPAPPPF